MRETDLPGLGRIDAPGSVVLEPNITHLGCGTERSLALLILAVVLSMDQWCLGGAWDVGRESMGGHEALGWGCRGLGARRRALVGYLGLALSLGVCGWGQGLRRGLGLDFLDYGGRTGIAAVWGWNLWR